MKGKTATFGERKRIIYGRERWEMLRSKREIAMEIMEALDSFGIQSILYGSTARGDVRKDSDVDIFIPMSIPSYKIELALQGFSILQRRIIQATPNHAIKGEIVLENATVSFPLAKMREKEMDFYRFGGYIDINGVMEGERVAGIDKRLMLIIPLKDGHYEMPANEVHKAEIADFLGVSVEIVEERFRVLERRRDIGRTGVFLNEVLNDHENFETKLKEITDRNPLVKRRLVL